MKFYWLVLFFGLFFISFPLDARDLVGPYQTAVLRQVDSADSGSSSLVLNRNFATNAPESLTFKSGDISSEFRITSDHTTDCGTRVLEGELEVVFNGNWRFERIRLSDDSEDVCAGHPSSTWQVEIEGKGRLDFVGEPRLVLDVNACLKSLEGTVCYDRYLPAVCGAGTVEGGDADIYPISESGTNLCYATLKLKQTACEEGIDPKFFSSEDIKCELKSGQD